MTFVPSRTIRWEWREEEIAGLPGALVKRWWGYDGERRMCAILGRPAGPSTVVYHGGKRQFGGVMGAKAWAQAAFGLQIVAVRWTEARNLLAIACRCGARFEHPADRHKVKCNCGRSADVAELRERVTW